MLNIGPPELLLIFVIALVIVGPHRLPELGRTIGKGLREFRKMQDEVKDLVNTGMGDEFRQTANELKSAASELRSTAADVKGATDVRSAFRTDHPRPRPHGSRRDDLPTGPSSRSNGADTTPPTGESSEGAAPETAPATETGDREAGEA